MPYLFCQAHGQEHAASCREREEEYRQLGETVVTVSGALTGGPWRCDRCNVRLRKGDRAFVVTAYPSHYASELTGYDYGYERRYFRLNQAEARVYGARPPGGIPSLATAQEGTA